MRPRAARTLLRASLACLTTGLVACLSPPVSISPSAAPHQIAQVGYGAEANYVQCTPPACPTRTPKTLDVPEVQAAQDIRQSEAAGPDSLPQEDVAAPSAATRNWNVPFTFGSARIGPLGQDILQQVIAALPATGRIQTGRIHIAGRTDSRGPAATNDALAAARAKVVHDYLVKARPDLAESMDIEAKGDCCFIAPNDTPASRARNRRVEIVLRPSAVVP